MGDIQDNVRRWHFLRRQRFTAIFHRQVEGACPKRLHKEYLSQENEDEVLLVLEINEEIEELSNYRKISFDLIWWSYSGLKVPNQAIVEQDGLNYVVRNRAGYLSKILVKVEKQNEKYSIVSSYTTDELRELGLTDSEIYNVKTLSVYDEIVLEPDLSKVE